MRPPSALPPLLRPGLCILAAALAGRACPAGELRPAIIYDFGGKFDRSFNQSASEGVARFTRETGIACREFEISNQAQRAQIMRQLVRHGATMIAGKLSICGTVP